MYGEYNTEKEEGKDKKKKTKEGKSIGEKMYWKTHLHNLWNKKRWWKLQSV